MLSAGEIGEVPATPVRRPWWPGEGTDGLERWHRSSRGDCLGEVALAARRRGSRGSGVDGSCSPGEVAQTSRGGSPRVVTRAIQPPDDTDLSGKVALAAGQTNSSGLGKWPWWL